MSPAERLDTSEHVDSIPQTNGYKNNNNDQINGVKETKPAINGKPEVDWANIALVDHLDEKNFKNGTTNGIKKLSREHVDDENDDEDQFEDLNLKIMGIGVAYPPNNVYPSDLDYLSQKYHKQNESMKKVLSINKFTGIEQRSSIGDKSHPIANMPNPPSISQLHDLFIEHAVPLSTDACRQALSEAHYSPSDITHTVFTTCTDSANPGFDHFVLAELGVRSNAQRILLHGVGCSGGLAALRTACGVALGAKARNKRARVLVCTAEISTTLVRSELESVELEDKVRVGLCLFSDCASAVVISNGVGENESSGNGVFDILGWQNEIVPETEHELGFDVDPLGWKVVLTPKVPLLTSLAVPKVFPKLIKSVSSARSAVPADYAWALHPGGSLILTSVAKAMQLTEEHLMASYEVYVNHGNSSSATIFSVLDKTRRNKDNAKEDVVACAFGPGISVEMMLLKRLDLHSGREVLSNGNGHDESINGVVAEALD